MSEREDKFLKTWSKMIFLCINSFLLLVLMVDYDVLNCIFHFNEFKFSTFGSFLLVVQLWKGVKLSKDGFKFIWNVEINYYSQHLEQYKASSWV